MDSSVFSSGNGMQTHVWGPLLWTFLHIVSFNYPVKPTVRQRLQYWDFLLKLRNVLPCRHCRENLQRNLVQAGLKPAVFDSRDTFSRFIYDLHNTVSQQLGKPRWDRSYEYLRSHIECVRARSSNKPKSATRGKEAGCTEPVVYGCPVATVFTSSTGLPKKHAR